jgi:hypothetical protein
MHPQAFGVIEANPDRTSVRDAAGDLWRNTLSRIESTFGRLVCLSSLRDPNSGFYEHFGLARSYGSKEADRVVREGHRKQFSDWLCLTIREQWLDLDQYLSRLGVDKRVVLREWERQAAYRHLVPADANDAERELYLCDFEMILALMRIAYETQLGQPTDLERWSEMAAMACAPRFRSECG